MEQINASPEVEVSALVRVLEAMWASIQRHHPEVPPAVILIGPGDHPVPIWGYWSPARWSVPTHGTRGEVLIAGESLARPAKHTLETLLHEAAHALATARKIQDTSRQGRYHNRRYKAFAEELGLTVAKHETYGWTLTATTSAVEEKYTAELAALQAAIHEQHGAHRRTALRALDEGEDGENGSDKGDEDDGTKGRRSQVRQCACTPARTIKVNPETYEQGYIMCGLCARPFLTPGESDEPHTRTKWLPYIERITPTPGESWNDA